MSEFQNLRSKIKKDPSMLEQAMDYAGRPAAAMREGVYAAQTDQPIIEALKRGIMQPSDMAPTGSDIADKFSESTGVENPYALAALATLGDVVDPANAIPMVGPLMKAPKAIKGMKKMERALSKVGDVEFPAENIAKAMQVEGALKKTGRVPESAVLQLGEKAPVEMAESIIGPGTKSIRMPKAEMDAALEQFPVIREQRKMKMLDAFVPKAVSEPLDNIDLEEAARQFPGLRQKLGF
jgi:hypothetical protein